MEFSSFKMLFETSLSAGCVSLTGTCLEPFWVEWDRNLKIIMITLGII